MLLILILWMGSFSQYTFYGKQRYTENVPKMKTGEIFPTDMVPVITGHLENKRAGNLFKWRFPNYLKSSGVIINARCETLHELS